MSPLKKPAPEPEQEPEQQPEPEQEQKPERGDPWQEPCPVCGLLGCRRHA